jgi:hypothetical protein
MVGFVFNFRGFNAILFPDKFNLFPYDFQKNAFIDKNILLSSGRLMLAKEYARGFLLSARGFHGL